MRLRLAPSKPWSWKTRVSRSSRFSSVIFGAGIGLFLFYRTVYRHGQATTLGLLMQSRIFRFEFCAPPVHRLPCFRNLLSRPAGCDVLLAIPIEGSYVNEHGPFDIGLVARHGQALDKLRVGGSFPQLGPAQYLQPG